MIVQLHQSDNLTTSVTIPQRQFVSSNLHDRTGSSAAQGKIISGQQQHALTVSKTLNESPQLINNNQLSPLKQTLDNSNVGVMQAESEVYYPPKISQTNKDLVNKVSASDENEIQEKKSYGQMGPSIPKKELEQKIPDQEVSLEESKSLQISKSIKVSHDHKVSSSKIMNFEQSKLSVIEEEKSFTTNEIISKSHQVKGELKSKYDGVAVNKSFPLSIEKNVENNTVLNNDFEKKEMVKEEKKLAKDIEVKPEEILIEVNSFPYNHFVGENHQEIIRTDIEFHGIELLMAHPLKMSELHDIINPCLQAKEVSEEVKKHLLMKKTILESLSLETKTEQIKYAIQTQQAFQFNQQVAKNLKANNNIKELARVEKRLELMKMTQSLTMAPPPNHSVHVTKMFEESKGPALEKRLTILRRLIDQYKQLYVYIRSNVITHQSAEEQAKTQKRIDEELGEKVHQAEKYIEKGLNNDLKQLSLFIKDQMKKLSPEMLHGKSLEERAKEIDEKIELLQQYKQNEQELLANLKQDQEEILESKSKIRSIEESIAKYNEHIMYLASLKNKDAQWIPVPQIRTRKIDRSYSFKNAHIDENTLMIEFKQIESLYKKFYFVQWNIDGEDAKVNKIVRCNKNDLSFSDIRKSTFTPEVMKTLHTKQMKVDLFSTGGGCFSSNKKIGSSAIDLSLFKQKDTIDGAAEFPGGIKLTYILKIKSQPKDIEFTVIDAFITVNPFEDIKDAFDKTKSLEAKVSEHMSRSSAILNVKNILVLIRPEEDNLESITKASLPSGLSLDEVLNPDNPKNINCFAFLEEMAAHLEDHRKELVKRMQKEKLQLINERWTQTMERLVSLKSDISQGNIDMETYAESLQKEIEKDKKLKELYVERRERARLAFIQEKIKMTEKELEECRAQLSQDG